MFRRIVSAIAKTDETSSKQSFSLDNILNPMDRKISNFEEYIHPAPESKPRTPFATDNPEQKSSFERFTPRQIARMMRQALPVYFYMQRTSRWYTGKFRPSRSSVTPEFIAELEALGRATGVKDMRYIRVPEYSIFKDKGIPYQYAIVYTVEMEKEPISSAPSFEAMEEVARGYKNLAIVGSTLGKFLRSHGYAAYPGTALGGVTDYVHLGELAGLGAIGYHGLLITPGEGARLRIATIYTNIENLPIQTENEHLWVRDFCAMCKKCVRQCPAEAIFNEPVPRGDGGMQCIDHGSCRDYFTNNYGCAVCLAVCPFSQAGYEKVQERFKGNPNAPQFHIPVQAISIVDQPTQGRS